MKERHFFGFFYLDLPNDINSINLELEYFDDTFFYNEPYYDFAHNLDHKDYYLSGFTTLRHLGNNNKLINLNNQAHEIEYNNPRYDIKIRKRDDGFEASYLNDNCYITFFTYDLNFLKELMDTFEIDDDSDFSHLLKLKKLKPFKDK